MGESKGEKLEREINTFCGINELPVLYASAS